MSTEALFSLGLCVITPGADRELQAIAVDPFELLYRHAVGDWGDLCREDKSLNQSALRWGDRLFSAYDLKNHVRVYVITEADRSVTTILLPIEY